MRTNIGSHVVMLLVGVMLVPSMAFAEQAGSEPSSRTLATVAAEHAAKKRADRQTVLNVLDREEVRRVAKGAGLRIEKAKEAVATLNAAELAQVVEQAKHVEDALAGGQAMKALKIAVIVIALLFIVAFLATMAVATSYAGS